MKSTQGRNALPHTAPRRSERIQQRRLEKTQPTQPSFRPEASTAASGSKRRFAEDTLSITVSEKRVKLNIKVEEEAAVEEHTTPLGDNTNNLGLLMDVAESKISPQEISDETPVDVDPYPLPIFRRRVYRPSPLSKSVFMDETRIPRYTEVLSTNACQNDRGLEVGTLPGAEAVWGERGGEDSGVGKRGGFDKICCGVGGESLFRDGRRLDGQDIEDSDDIPSADTAL
ncbi:hypothetical protein HDU77_008730 [Chytriomyces hyalinus]|nr:hypothetical protein HDU77_008730 [Chytriomyces hyalinus]